MSNKKAGQIKTGFSISSVLADFLVSFSNKE